MNTRLENGISSIKRIHIKTDSRSIRSFFQILQDGFEIECPIGISIKEFLVDFMNIDERYVKERINTIFLDGKCVDDIENSLIEQGSSLALSSALPGLVGAILKRDGPLKVMREGISYRREERFLDKKQGMCSVKLFNLMMEELGPLFFGLGINIKGRNLSGLLSLRPLVSWSENTAITIDGESVSPDKLTAILADIDEATIRLTFDERWDR